MRDGRQLNTGRPRRATTCCSLSSSFNARPVCPPYLWPHANRARQRQQQVFSRLLNNNNKCRRLRRRRRRYRLENQIRPGEPPFVSLQREGSVAKRDCCSCLWTDENGDLLDMGNESAASIKLEGSRRQDSSRAMQMSQKMGNKVNFLSSWPTLRERSARPLVACRLLALSTLDGRHTATT